MREGHEVHLTVELGGQSPELLSEWARVQGCRFLHVLLESGAHSSQPMLSWRQAGGIDAALERAANVEQALGGHGVTLARIKIEAPLESVADARYFEAHFKIEIEDGRLSELHGLAQELGAHLSRNARTRHQGKQERFVTARYGSREAALAGFERLEIALSAQSFSILSVDREAVVYDSNLELDAGWAT